MKMYIEKHAAHAGKWIYEGYKSAWENIGYDCEFINVKNFEPKEEEYDIMTLDGAIDHNNLKILEHARRAYLYVQPTTFPEPWGSHPNFVSLCPPEIIQPINDMENVYKWSFAKITDYHNKWNHVNSIPLAFDSNAYKAVEDKKFQFDVCYVGGWANNGFDEKRKIMIEYFKEFKDSGLKCGFFINKGLTHEQENKVLYNSKVSINIHDAYQRKLGLDTNERTFKSLGLTGILVSDDVSHIKEILPEVLISENPKHMKEMVLNILDQDMEETRERNREHILSNHTYVSRAKQMEGL
tara:strand:- start:4750 stop:5637 length:888 start_codon:yes stop_codon:yes gene_type:complete